MYFLDYIQKFTWYVGHSGIHTEPPITIPDKRLEGNTRCEWKDEGWRWVGGWWVTAFLILVVFRFCFHHLSTYFAIESEGNKCWCHDTVYDILVWEESCNDLILQVWNSYKEEKKCREEKSKGTISEVEGRRVEQNRVKHHIISYNAIRQHTV